MFHSPSVWFLLILLLVPLIAWIRYRGQPAAIPFSSTDTLRSLPRTWKQRLRWLPTALLLAGISVSVVALARPQEDRKHTINESEGIAIEMLVDRSGSMQAMDFKIDGNHVDRLTAIKNVASKFILGDGELDGRFNDLIGLITFARHADGLTPPTLDHPFLVNQLNETQIVTERSEDGTAIGDAIGLAVEKLTALDDTESRKMKSKIIILLTDGENNAGDVDPIQAAELAETLGIKIYAIGVGTKGNAPVPVQDPFTGRRVIQWMPVNIDEKTLTKISDLTGGKYFRATNSESLKEIYAIIDELEKSKIEAKQYVDYREWAIEPVHMAGMRMPPLTLIAFVLLATRAILTNTLFRGITELN